MLSYTEHRQRRIEAAGSYSGWDRPPYPFQNGGKCRARAVMTTTRFLHTQIAPGSYLYAFPANAELDRIFKAKEKAQNRKHFS